MTWVGWVSSLAASTGMFLMICGVACAMMHAEPQTIWEKHDDV